MKTFVLYLAVAVVAASVVVLSWRDPAGPAAAIQPVTPAAPPTIAARPPDDARLRQAEAALAELRVSNAALSEELAILKKSQEVRQAEVAFSYGSPRDSGRFVGLTLRGLLDASLATDPEVARSLREQNRLNELSLGPFIRDAETIEADPERFAQFQGGLVSEVLDLDGRHEIEVEALLQAFKAQSLRVEIGSSVWVQLDRSVRERITALLPPEVRAAKNEHIRFFETYGMLLVPAYAILKDPAAP